MAPAASPCDWPSTSAADPARAALDQPEDAGGSVLVVDDSEDTARSLVELLRGARLTAAWVSSGQAAIGAARREPPDLVLLDMRMPGMSGLDVCRQVKADPVLETVPVIFMSASQDADDRVEAFRCGAVDFITRPFHAAEVLARVGTHLHLRRLRRALEWRNEQLTREGRLATERLQVISRAARDALIMLESDGSISHWNEAAEQIFGWKRSEAIGRNLHALLAPERFLPAHREGFEVFRSTGTGAAVGQTLELVARSKAGLELPIELSLAATQLDGKWCAVGVVRDITARKREQAELLFSNLLMTTQREAALDGILVVDPAGVVVSHNRKLGEMWGLGHAVLDTRSETKLVETLAAWVTDPESFVQRVAWLHRHPMERSREELRLRDGRTFEHYSAPMVATDGKNYGRVSFFRDVTDRKQAERAIRENEARYRASFEGASVGQALVDLDGRLLETNRALAKMLGREGGELVGRSLADVAHPDDLPLLRDATAKLSADLVAAQRAELRLMRKDGGTLWADVSVGALRDASASPTRLIMHVIDVSGRKAAEEHLRSEMAKRQQMELELRHSQKLEAVGQLAAGIAHEINTPTQFVGDGVQFLKDSFAGVLRLLPRYRAALEAVRDGAGAAEVLAELRRLEEEVDLDYTLENVPPSIERSLEGISRIATIVRAMKEFAHADQREQSPADLNQALQATLVIAKNEYKYVADVDLDLGELPPVMCHVGDLNQVFLNLIVNAAHAIADVVGQTGRRGVIRIKTCRDGDAARIDVADSGTGIAETARDHIFEPFFTTKPVGKGTGQGLAIARSIVVEKHAGSLTFTTTVGEGTVFTIRLPVDGRPGARDRSPAGLAREGPPA